MKATFLALRPTIGLLSFCAILALPATRVLADDTNADAFPTYESYIKISGLAPAIAGDNAAFANRAGMPTDGAYGIEDLFYTKDLSNGTSLTLNGRALSGSDDYLAELNLAKDNVGSVDVGYKLFRVYYDGVGGFFPLADEFQQMSGAQLHVDRGAFWANIKVARPDSPVFTLSFRDEIRTGEKDSTEWAAIINPDATITNGALVGTAAPVNTPYIAPNLLSLAEHHDLLQGSVTETAGKTTETFTASADWVNNIDTRYYTKYPNSTVIADPTVNVLDDQEANKSHSFRLLNQTETAITDQLAVETGLTYLHVTAADGGEWLTPTYSTTAKAVYTAETAADIVANARLDDYVGNIFLKYTPGQNWLFDAGVRDEFNVISDAGGFENTSLVSTAKTVSLANTTIKEEDTYSHQDDHVVTPEISFSYKGFDGISIYGSADKRTDNGQQHWINPYAVTSTTNGVVTTATAPLSSMYFQGADQDNDNAKVGIDWKAASFLTLRAEVFRKDDQNRFIGSNDYVGTGSYGALYATGYTFTGVTLSAIVKPIPELSFTTRYQPQNGEMAVTGNTVTGGNGTEVTSGRAASQLVSETVDWTPYRQFYAQASINLVYNYIQTAYPDVTVAPNVASPIVNANNNYVTGSVLLGFVVDKLTDAQIQGTWQHADNYNPQVELGGQPYGSSFEFENVTVGVKHKFADRLIGDFKVGYLKSTDGTTGGFTNYHGPLAYASLTIAL